MYTLNMTMEQVNILLEGLAEMPAKKSYVVINQIYAQVSQQDAANAEKKEAAAPENNDKG